MNSSHTLEDAQEELYSHQLQVSDTLYCTAAKYDEDSSSQSPIRSYEEGDLVSVYRSRDSQLLSKLTPPWVGPATIIKHNNLEYSVKLSNRKIVNRLHPRYLFPYLENVLKGKSVVELVDNKSYQEHLPPDGNKNLGPPKRRVRRPRRITK